MKDILIIDDESPIRETLGGLLSRAGKTWEGAGDRLEGLDRLSSGGFRAILLDLRLPDVEGFGLLDEVRRAHPRLAVIMMTAYATVKTAVEAMKRGALDFVTKPIDREDLLRV